MPVPKSVVYKDFDIIFDRHPVTRKLNTLTNNDAVKRYLLINLKEHTVQTLVVISNQDCLNSLIQILLMI